MRRTTVNETHDRYNETHDRYNETHDRASLHGFALRNPIP